MLKWLEKPDDIEEMLVGRENNGTLTVFFRHGRLALPLPLLVHEIPYFQRDRFWDEVAVPRVRRVLGITEKEPPPADG